MFLSVNCKALRVSFLECLFALLFLTSPLKAEDSTPGPHHGIALYGSPLYPSNFKHFAHVNSKAPKGGILKLQAIGSFDSFNPFIIKGKPGAGLSPLYPSYVYVTLMFQSYDEPFAQYGYLAKTVEVAPDRTWVEFELRENAKFHDGSPITPEDVIFSYETLKTKGSPLYRAYYGSVGKAEKTGPRKVRFELKDPKNRELALILGTFPIFSKAYYTKYPFDKADLNIPLGNGPYRIAKVDAGRRITFERVRNWWGENLGPMKGRYNFDVITYDYYRDTDVAFEAFKSNEYDFRLENSIKKWVKDYNVEPSKKDQLVKLEVPDIDSGIMMDLVYNLRREKFQDRKVREALGYALDFDWMNDNLFYNQYKQCYSYFSKTELASQGPLPAEERAILEPYKDQLWPEIFEKVYTPTKGDKNGNSRENLKKARDLLKEAGWIVQEGFLVSAKTKEPFVFELLLVQPEMVRMVSNFIQNLGQLGVQVKLRVVETSQYISRTNSYDYDMIIATKGQSLSPGNEQRDFWSSKAADIPGGRNYGGIQNPVIDQLVEELIQANDRQTLVNHARALDRVLLWGYYGIPLYYSPVNRYAYWNKITHSGKFPKYVFDIDAFWARDNRKGS